jgi:hypothetical protein
MHYIRTLDWALHGQPAQLVPAAHKLAVAKLVGSTVCSRTARMLRLHTVLTRSQPGALTGDHGRTDHSGDEAIGWLKALARWASLQVYNSVHDTPNSPRGASPTKESLMPEHPDTASLFAQCIALNREAFAAGYYNTAYHALAAALYVAHARQETEGLARVERLAVEQLAVIDATAPAYEYSTRSADASGLPSIFTMLAREAQAMRLRLPVVRGECRAK